MALELVVDSALITFAGAFILVFAIVYGLLSYAKMFEFPKNVNAAIAFVFAIFAASFQPFREGLAAFLPILMIPLVLLFLLIFMKELFKPKEKEKAADLLPPVVIIATGLFLLGRFWENIGFSVAGLSAGNVLWLIGIITVLILFGAIYYHGSGG